MLRAEPISISACVLLGFVFAALALHYQMARQVKFISIAHFTQQVQTQFSLKKKDASHASLINCMDIIYKTV